MMLLMCLSLMWDPSLPGCPGGPLRPGGPCLVSPEEELQHHLNISLVWSKPQYRVFVNSYQNKLTYQKDPEYPVLQEALEVLVGRAVQTLRKLLLEVKTQEI